MEHTAAAVPPQSHAGVSPNTYFLLRRLHSLFGVFPLGVFLANHLFINAFASRGPSAFNEKVELLRSLPLLPLIEFGFIFVPLTLHAVLGVFIARQGLHNPLRYPYWRNWMYTLQRYSGWLVLGFVIFHVWTLRFGNNPEYLDFYTLLHDSFRISPVLLGLYLVGGLATIYHFCNGLCTFCMTWGLTVSRTSQRAMAAAAAAIGLGLATLLAVSILGFLGRFDLIPF